MQFSALNQPSGAGVSPNERTGPGLSTKILLAMKLTIVFLTVAFFQVQASAIAQSVTLSAKKMPLSNVFKIIEKQTGLSVFYNSEQIKNAGPVTLEARNMPVEDFLKTVLKQEQLSYEISKGNILIKYREKPVKASDFVVPIKLSGTVLGDDKQPLIGATIRVKGQQVSAVSDEHGNFQIAVEPGAVIVVSYIGFEEKEVKITGEEAIKITLNAVETVLEAAEIVSTGYQKISRERSAGSFSKPNLDIMKNRSGSANILSRLDGLVPGLVVNNAPSASQNPFLVRGLATIGLYDEFGNAVPGGASRSPLIVVDGVPQDNISAINTQDVEDITVLKDATAASIWGTRAANGVIVVTTKKGKAGNKLSIEYDGFVNFQGKPDLNYIQRLNSRDFITASGEVFQQSKASYPFGLASQLAALRPHQVIQYNREAGLISVAQEAKSLDSLAAINNTGEIADLFYRNATLTNQTISVSGGGKAYAFYGSVSYTGTRSNQPGQKDDLYKINFRQDLVLNKSISLFLITDISNSQTSSPIDISLSPNFVPYQLFRDAAGNPLTINHMGDFSDARRLDYQNRSGINLEYNPLNERNLGYNKSDQLYSRIVGGGTVKILKNLRFEGNYGYNILSANATGFLDANSYTVRRELLDFTVAVPGEAPVYYLPNSGGRLTENNSYLKNYSIRNQLVFDQNWQKHQLTVLAGQEATSQYGRATQIIVRGWDDKLQIGQPIDYKTLNAGVDGTITNASTFLDQNFTGGESPVVRTSSYYSNLSYSYMGKYTLNGSWRNDQSNLFGRDKSAQNRPVWSIGGKWRLGEESFMPGNDWLNRLDLRATYGVAGNAPQPGTAASYDILKADAGPYYVTGMGLIIGTPGNDKLTWESTVIKNAGVDFGLLGGRLGGSIDAYIKNTTDLLGNLPVSPFSGYQNVVGNLGSIQNKGFEIGLNSINVVGKNFFWSTNFTLGYNKNKVIRIESLGTIATGTEMISQRYVAGYPAFSLFAFDYAGLNNNGDPQIRLADGTITTDPVASKATDVKFMGTTQPLWAGGLSNGFSYRDFSLNINLVYNLGHVMFRDVNTFWSEPMYDNVHAEFADRWKVRGDENKTNIPRYIGNKAENSDRNTTYYTAANINVFNASFVKVRDITLAYNLPEKLINQLKVRAITFRAQVSNLMLWKANKLGIDPEFQDSGLYGSGRTLRTGQGSLTLGAHVSF